MLSDRPSILRRAVGLVGSDGQPVDGLVDPKLHSRKRSYGFSANLRRRFSDIVRTRSFTAPKSHRPIPVHAHTVDEFTTPRPGTSNIAEVPVPLVLQSGTSLTKVTAKNHKKVVFRLDADQGQIVWEGKRHRIIPIESIKEIRSGQDARYYREQFQYTPESEERWLTIIYILDGTYKTLHVIAQTTEIFHMWNTTLRKLHSIRQELMKGLGNVEMRQAMWEKHYWKNADEESDQKLVFEEVEKLCRRLNMSTGVDDLYRLFKEADKHNRDYLDFSDFQRFVKLLKSRPEIDRLYNKSRIDGSFNFTAFETFMKEKQHSSHTRQELEIIFGKYSTTTPSSLPLYADGVSDPTTPDVTPIMTWESFTSFLMSSDNSALRDLERHDMTLPLSEYYISSSHNTYLVGHQLVGASTIEGYIRALLHSCRSVEIDVFDGDDEPMIFHGKTLTTKVSLREVCEAIMKYGFVASQYPIIISAEIHCCIEQQDKVADIMIEVFGDTLVRRRDDEPVVEIKTLPSPEALKHKVLLKTKNAYLARSDTSDDLLLDVSASSADDSEDDIRRMKRRQSDTVVQDIRSEFRRAKSVVIKRVRSRGRGSVPPPLPRSPTIPESAPATPTRPSVWKRHTRSSSVTILEPTRSPPSSPSMLAFARSPPVVIDALPKPKMSHKLLSLLVYTVGVKCRGINKKEEYAPEHMFSLSENAVNKLIRGGAMIDLIKHARGHLVRIYPKGTRLSSSNYEPHRYWSAGAQLVALNWQTFDLGYMMNHAMFQRNGRLGYVLKPSALRLGSKDRLSHRTEHYLDVSIISAQQLPRPKDASGREIIEKGTVDPYVEVSLHVPDWTHEDEAFVPHTPNGVDGGLNYSPPTTNPSTARTITYRTGVVKNNGFNPVWEENLRIPFDCVADMKELIFVRFAVRQGGQDVEEPLAVFCASLGSLQRGYRHLPLHDSQMTQFLYSTLFAIDHNNSSLCMILFIPATFVVLGNITNYRYHLKLRKIWAERNRRETLCKKS